MIPFTGACERPWAAARSRSSRPTTPASRSPSATRIPLWPCRWHATSARATVSSGPTVREVRDAVDIALPPDCGDEDLDAAVRARLQSLEDRAEQLTLLLCQRRVQE